jgi:hypothetical protein
VVQDDAGSLVLFDPALSRLRHRAFPALDDMFMAAINDNARAALNVGSGTYETAVDWVRSAPGGGTFKLRWGVFAGRPSWADDLAYYQQTAKAATNTCAQARRPGYIMVVTSD